MAHKIEDITYTLRISNITTFNAIKQGVQGV
jgi:hypothetical protein